MSAKKVLVKAKVVLALYPRLKYGPFGTFDATDQPDVLAHLQSLNSAVWLLDSNTVSIEYTPLFVTLPVELQQALLTSQRSAPFIVERELDPVTGKATETGQMVIRTVTDVLPNNTVGTALSVYAPQYLNMGLLKQIVYQGNGIGYFIHTHYHTTPGCSFSYHAFERALKEYCIFAKLSGLEGKAVVVNLPGLQCNDVLDRVWVQTPGTQTLSEVIPANDKGELPRIKLEASLKHIATIKQLIEDTMFPNAHVILTM